MSQSRQVVGTLKLPVQDGAKGIRRGTRVHHGGGRMPVENDRMPQDVKTSPDGKLFYVADMMADGVSRDSTRAFRSGRISALRAVEPTVSIPVAMRGCSTARTVTRVRFL